MHIGKINLEKFGLSSVVSDLEADILNQLWKKNQASAKELLSILKGKHRIANSTISVTLDRLYEKGFVTRKTMHELGGIKYIYYPAMSKNEIGFKIADEVAKYMAKSFGDSSTAYLKKKLGSDKK